MECRVHTLSRNDITSTRALWKSVCVCERERVCVCVCVCQGRDSGDRTECRPPPTKRESRNDVPSTRAPVPEEGGRQGCAGMHIYIYIYICRRRGGVRAGRAALHKCEAVPERARI